MNKRLVTFIIIIILVLIILFGAYRVYYIFDKGGIYNDTVSEQLEEKEFSIVEGTSVREISKNLENLGIIDNWFMFELKIRHIRQSGKIMAGDFSLNNKMDFYEIVSTLQNPISNYITFLIKEGETQEEIGENLEEQGIVSKEDFINECNNGEFKYSFLVDLPNRESRLEGYLFPDTYYFAEDITSYQIVDKLLARFNNVFTEEYKERAQKLGLSLDEVVIIASMIEKEVRYKPERETVASVIYNRLKQGMKLQLDATVLYILDEKKDRLYYKDLEIKSDYNTYYVDALPVGPISNPGEGCIKATLYPNNTDYIYYVVKDSNTGEHFFTDSYNEFLKAKETYLKNK